MYDIRYYKTLWYFISIFFSFFVELWLIDDEPLWESVEWSVFMSWLMFIGAWTWFLGVFFSSRYGSYSPQDRVLWVGLYKVNTFFETSFFFNMLFITVFVTLPFYYEVTYSLSNVFLWWSVYNTRLFLKAGIFFSLFYKTSFFLRLQLRWFSVFSLSFLLIILLALVAYLLFFLFINLLFTPLSDMYSYMRRGWLGLEQLTQGPCKWGSGPSSRDHFSYHKSTTVFWFKNDPLLAGSLFFFCLLFYLFTLFLYIQIFFLLCALHTSRTVSFNNLALLVYSCRRFQTFILFFCWVFILSFIFHSLRIPLNPQYSNRFFLIASFVVKIFWDFIEEVGEYFDFLILFLYASFFLLLARSLILRRFYFLAFFILTWFFLFITLCSSITFWEFVELNIYPLLLEALNYLQPLLVWVHKFVEWLRSF